MSVSVGDPQRGSYPARAVALLRSDVGSCLATFTGPRELRTAAHCVYDFEGRPLTPPRLEVVLWPEVAARVGRSSAQVSAVEPAADFAYDSECEWYEDYATVRISEPLGEKVGYFGAYRRHRGYLGSLGGENRSGLCRYGEYNAPILDTEWRDPVNYEVARTVAQVWPSLAYSLLDRLHEPIDGYVCRMGNDWARHPTGDDYYEPFRTGRLPLRVDTCRLDRVTSILRLATDSSNRLDPCVTQHGDSGGPVYILEDGLPTLVAVHKGWLPGVQRESSLGEFRTDYSFLLAERMLDGRTPDLLRYPVQGDPEVLMAGEKILPWLSKRLGDQGTPGEGGRDVLLLPIGDFLFEEGVYELALKAYRIASDAGHFRATYALYVMYRDGLGVPPNPSEAVTWLLEAAERGCPRAQAFAAQAYLEGDLLPFDLAKAIALLESAVSAPAGSIFDGARSPRALAIAGQLHTGLLGFDRNLAEADRLLRAAAEEESPEPEAMWLLYQLHCESAEASEEACREIGGPMLQRTVRYPGMTAARHRLGHLLDDPIQAQALWTIAAEEGHEEAAEHLAESTLDAAGRTAADELAAELREAISGHRYPPSGVPACFLREMPRWLLDDKYSNVGCLGAYHATNAILESESACEYRSAPAVAELAREVRRLVLDDARGVCPGLRAHLESRGELTE